MTENLSGLNGSSFLCSWSGGKDSCLALYRAVQAGGVPQRLLTMLTEGGTRSRSHGLDRAIIAAQAAALGLPLRTAAATWENYEAAFGRLLREGRESGIGSGVFGDIDTEGSREWVHQVCNATAVTPYLPLWRDDRAHLVHEFINLGFKAVIVAARDGVVGRDWLGRVLDLDLFAELASLGIDPCGENGEFHTVVLDGPSFTRPVLVEPKGAVLRDGYWFLDLRLA